MKLTKILCGAIVFFSMNTVIAQNWLELREQGANFKQIQAAFNRENGGKIKKFKRELVEEANGKAPRAGKFEREMEGMVQYYRWEAFVEPRVKEADGDRAAMSEGMMRAIAKKRDEIQTRAANWTLMGPKSTPTEGGNGRINAVRVHPTDPNTLFACAPAGGLWKSSNGGSSWVAVSDAISALGCTDVAFDPTNPNTMYLLTGDGEAGDVFTLGVYKSTNGGNSWAATGLVFTLSNSKILSKILVHPTNGNTIIVGGSAGIYRSTDGGSTWSQRATGSMRDLEFKPSDPSVMYAGGYGASAGFWRSSDGGVTWVKNTTTMAAGVQRVAIGVSPANANYVYALAAKTTSFGFEGLYLSTDSGNSFTKQSSTPNILGWSLGTAAQADQTDGQGWYDLSLAVSPTDINTIFTGGVNIWKSTTGGASWAKMTAWEAFASASNYTHADIHDLCYYGSNLYVGCDGGVFKTANEGANWSDLSSNMSIAQMYGLGLSATSETTIMSGHQDNGTNLTTNGTTWSEVNGGDGMLCFIDRTNNNNLFSSIYNGNLYRSTNGGAGFSKIYTVPGGGWVTPWLQDPVVATTIYAGGTNVMKSINSGTTWTAVSAFAVGTLLALDVAKTNNQVLVAASKTKVMKTVNGGTAWTDITAGLPANPSIQTVHIDVNDANKIYVGLASYTGNNAFMSTNGGTTWTNISAGMPQIPINCFVTQNNVGGVVYCGNDLGVYYSANSGATWESFSNGMPGITVMDLEIFYPTNRLRAATYGRGIWDSNLNGSNQAPSVSITSPANNASFSAPAAVTITANASDADGSISKVEFYNGTTLLGTATAAPYTFTWSNVATGSYVLTAKAYDNAGAIATSAAIAISVSVANDAGISAITTPNGAVNAANVIPSIILKNYGSAALTAVSILYKVDNGTENTYNWTGLVAANATTSVNLPNVTGYAAGSHTFTARTANPNGTTDGNAANDATTSNFSFSTCSNINEPTDNTATSATIFIANTSVNSQIGTATDVDYYKIITTATAPKVKLTLTNLPADYDVSLYRATTSGTISSIITTSQNSNTTAESIVYNTPTAAAVYYIKVFGYAGASSTSQCYNLTINTSTSSFIRQTRENELKSDASKNLIVFPNPADDNVSVRYNTLEAGTFTIQLVDVAGKVMIQQSQQFENGENSVELNTSNIAQGLYFVKLSNETQTAVSKLLIEK